MTPDFWRGKRVFMTGHTGFKGSWLALWLQSCGAVVHGYALNPPTRPALFEEAGVARGLHGSTLADVRDAAALAQALRRSEPEVVLHLAAQPLVRAGYADPLGTFASNVMGTAHLLEAVRGVGSVRCVVVVTTDKCYENREWDWGYREDEPMGGHDPYSSSKACAELLTAAWRRSFLSAQGVAVATARAGNVIGGGDWAEDRLVPDALRAFDAGRVLEVRHPGAVRPWQHVLEPLDGYLTLAEALWRDGPAHAQAWNFGPGEDDAWPVGRIADHLVRSWGDGAAWRDVGAANQPHEAHWLRLDVSKARHRLGWRPRWPLERALEATVRWHREWRAGRGARELCLRQIGEFQA